MDPLLIQTFLSNLKPHLVVPVKQMITEWSTPFTHVQIDFTHMPKEGKKQQYLLVIVDMMSRWPEIFVTNNDNA